MRPSEERPGDPAEPSGPSAGGHRPGPRARGSRGNRTEPKERPRRGVRDRWSGVIAVAGPVLTVTILATLVAWLVGRLRRVAARSIASLSTPDPVVSGGGTTGAAAFRTLAAALGELSSVDGALGPLVGALLALAGCWAVALGAAHVTARLLARFLARR